ncbi:hypothetical protein SMD44_00912 [Streptomyces alboflavus]|uniref:Uncharacterized protein n=1 Tax=Streptomyces alboflavus TaxID=67267 RepID=A0A1Z1W527_9ACTN|nr:hypothetical protein [Streptomyces alboflavus]ARX81514.1 hypothetical protein SMD44_00912 [Streptomyces alboflavus]
MSQQIPIEDALDAFRKKCGELLDANVLLEARAISLERRVEELESAGGSQAATGVPGGQDAAS